MKLFKKNPEADTNLLQDFLFTIFLLFLSNEFYAIINNIIYGQ